MKINENTNIILEQGGKSIIIKIMFTRKGFGIQVYNKPEGSKQRKLLLAFTDNKVYESDYVGIWKLTPPIMKSIQQSVKIGVLSKYKSHK